MPTSPRSDPFTSSKAAKARETPGGVQHGAATASGPAGREPRHQKEKLALRARSPEFWRNKAVWAAVMVVYVAGLFVSASVVAPTRAPEILRQTAPLACLALGQTVLIIGRNLDLSVGGVVGLVNVIAAAPIAQDIGGSWAIVVCLAIGLLVGAVNGVGVALVGISPFIMTLGSSFFLSGAALVYSGGAPSGQLPSAIRILSEYHLFGFALDVYITAALFVVTGVVLARTWPGRMLYARGMNPAAARIGGVSLLRVDITSYVFSGLCAALGGLFLAGAVGQGSLGAGEDLLLNSIAAVVVGGTTFVGGKGGVVGTAGGALLFTLVTAVLIAAGLGAGGIAIVSGVVLLTAAALFRQSRGAA